ncbi:hypothetical protein CAPTEDRAFT_96666 [Capitella teleta]|uniref:Sterol regulatory element-binding protein cleavage-activating protein n=1 Tax=Capitella teleta TaxID=283909 RepID=R7UJ94_CAPTE|nr:hypothetical protein CAPTEDRAFT_96666 [Capitella teleta]|eukprot:ELU06614.1 hypothetical protein CAPTEDRAFT_96666 [Capitella teleta]
MQDKISSLFYLHGLFCASHPVAIISLVIITFCLICSPVAYVQQIVVKSVVSPWEHEKLIPSDAFRGPLLSVFDVLDHINNFNDPSSVQDYCLRVGDLVLNKSVKDLFIVKGVSRILPQHSCLVVSPANLWNKDRVKFAADGEIIKTVLQQFGEPLDTPPGVKDILFGVPWKDTGLKRYYIRNRQRVISFAVTIVFKEYDPKFIDGLKAKLERAFPLSLLSNASASDVTGQMYHVHYKAINYIAEYLPLLVTYALLFMYILFSVSKIEMVKSKWGLALSAVITVVASLLIAVSVCLMVGLTPSLSGSEIFPYLVVIIGLENNLVLTKSVVSTPVHLDVKLRVAQGLSKEGWYIFKNMIMELAVLAFGFVSMVPPIQEFALFAVVGLLSDFFLQMFFFATVLSIDIRRMEVMTVNHLTPSGSNTFPTPKPADPSAPSQNSRFSFFRGWRGSTSGVEAGDGESVPFRTPRRLRLLNFWAKTRIIQRAMMTCVVIWVLLFVYKTSLVDEVSDNNSTSTTATLTPPMQDQGHAKLDLEVHKADLGKNVRDTIMGEGQKWIQTLISHEERGPWSQLSHSHWPTLFGYYNISLEGRYITILPPIALSAAIPPAEAIRIRHAEEMKAASRTYQQTSDWMQPNESSPLDIVLQRLTRYPRTTLELVATVMFVIANVMIVTFSFIWLYKCVCTRRYAKWRSAWNRNRKSKKDAQYCKKIRESLPIILRGHRQEVECVVTDGPFVVSSCLGGQIRVWDSATGEPMTSINRQNPPVFLNQMESSMLSTRVTPSVVPPEPSSDSRSRSSSFLTKSAALAKPFGHSRHKSADLAISNFMPDFSETVDTNFASIPQRLPASASSENLQRSGYDFTHFEIELTDSEFDFDILGSEQKSAAKKAPAVWCLECKDNLIVVGCSNGRLELWDGFSGQLKYIHHHSNVGITAICFIGNKIVAARLNGTLDFYELETFMNVHNHSNSSPRIPRSPYTRRAGSVSSAPEMKSWDDILHVALITSAHAHQQPILSLKAQGARAVTASQDHTLKVFRLEDSLCLYTLHGHTAAVTALCLDSSHPLAAISGSDDGDVRVWDLLTGACVHKLQGHEVSRVTAVTSTQNYIISTGVDDRLCVWDRCKGHLLHWVQMEVGYINCVSMLTSNLMLTGGQGSLYLWDIGKGEVLRDVVLGDYDSSIFVRQIHVIDQSTVVCDYGSQVCVIHFPSVLEKSD